MSKLYFRHAAMNAGKSTALLQAAHDYEERGNERYRAVCPTCFYSAFEDSVRAPGLFG